MQMTKTIQKILYAADKQDSFPLTEAEEAVH